MLTNLKDILAAATVANPDEYVEKEITWKQGDQEYTATVQILANISFAASERITLGTMKSENAERIARSIVERVRFSGEKMSFDQASSLTPELGWALAMAILDFDKSKEPAQAKV